MLKHLSIKARLIFVIGLLSFTAIAIGAVGLFNLNATNAALGTVYNDRLVPTGQLADILSMIQQNQNTLTRAVNVEQQEVPKLMAEVDERIGKISEIWKTYMATRLTEKEKALAQKFADSRAKFVEAGLRPTMAAFRNNEIASASMLVQGTLRETFIPVRDNMRALVDLQLEIGKKEFVESQARFESARPLHFDFPGTSRKDRGTSQVIVTIQLFHHR